MSFTILPVFVVGPMPGFMLTAGTGARRCMSAISCAVSDPNIPLYLIDSLKSLMAFIFYRIPAF